MSTPSSSPEFDPQDAEMLVRLGVDAQTTSFMAVAFFALLLYDHLTTLDKENRYFSLFVIGVCASGEFLIAISRRCEFYNAPPVYVQHVNDDAHLARWARLTEYAADANYMLASAT
ncbi:hypothetical protein B0H19DRAFT_1255343 [Mycena capillaripes]|nr:hypothetical protein B0H19DRAFT_1255343 [Mycena capillaripes]